MCKKVALLLLIFSSIFITGCQNGAEKNSEKEITISVAASLNNPIGELVELFEGENNIKININSGSTGVLKKQILNGAEVDLFFSANENYIDELIKEGIVKEEEVIKPIGNSLVLVKNNNTDIKINDLNNLKEVKEKIAVGEVSTVPAGKYAKEALEKLGLWNKLQDKIVYGKDVEAVKKYVDIGDASLGFIYKSDTKSLKNSSVVLEIPKDSHEDIIYPLAIINNSKEKDIAKSFVEFIKSDKAKEVFLKYGFEIKG